jgi:hypothetical protein
MFMALFRSFVRRLKSSRVRALTISEYSRGTIVVREAPGLGGWIAESSPDGGNTVFGGFGDTPFGALTRLIVFPYRASNVRAFQAFHASPQSSRETQEVLK